MTLDAARAAFARGAFEEALSLATRAIQSSPDEPRQLRINAALKLERWQIAADDLQWLLDKRGANPKLSQTLSECWVRIGNTEKLARPDVALAAYRKALDANATNSSARFNMALVLSASGHPRDAIHALDALLVNDTADNAAALLRAEQLIVVGDDDAAIATLRAIADSLDDEQRRRASMLFVEAGATPEAMTLAGGVTPPPPDWKLAFARKLRAFGAMDAAERWLVSDDEIRFALPRALGLPSASMRPCSSRIARSESCFTRPRSWDTKSTVILRSRSS